MLPDELQPIFAQQQQQFQHTAAFNALLAQHPDIANSHARVWACSPFAFQICNRYFNLFNELVKSGDLQRHYSPTDYLDKLQRDIPQIDHEPLFWQQLRQMRALEMLRIVWRDLAGWSDLTEQLADLSQLADAMIQFVVEKLYALQVARFGTPCDAKGLPQPLLVLGMGKLGGRELNFSSDIDLIFCYPDTGQTQHPNPKQVRDNQEFFTRLGQKVIQALNNKTADGFVYRVDMRLRPFGDSGALVATFAALEDYYQSHGREWERYAMIKMRVINGTLAEQQTVAKLIQPFVYRRYLDFSAFRALQEMKQQINQEMRRKGQATDLKLGQGGIREIEFICQALQLLRGGRQPLLQQRHLLTSLRHLAQCKLLPETVATELSQAYIFLRTAEHRLQMIEDQQTQCLPSDRLNQQRLTFAMGFPDWPRFLDTLQALQQRVHSHYNQVVSGVYCDEDVCAMATQPPRYDWVIVWQQCRQNPAQIDKKILQQQGFKQSDRLVEKLQQFLSSYGVRNMDALSDSRLQQFMPLLLAQVSQAKTPDATFLRLLLLVEKIARRSVYLSLLLENPRALALLVNLFEQSEWVAQQVTQYPLLLDGLLDSRRLYDILDSHALDNALQANLTHLPLDDMEMQMDVMRQFKLAQVLSIAASELAGKLAVEKTSDYLTAIADSLIRQTLAMAWQQLAEKHGEPRVERDGSLQKVGFCIIAYGKAGGIEMSYGSDIDMVFLHDSEGDGHTDGAKSLDNNVFFARLAKRIIHLLMTPTAAGYLYQVDNRLRPRGNAGLLVSSLAAFWQYQQSEAWTWEHQALIRARPVAGDVACQQQFTALRHEILSQPRDLEKLRRDIHAMRQKMRDNLDRSTTEVFDLKQGAGGITDIEFLVQYWVLRHAHLYPVLISNTGMLPLLKFCFQNQLVSEEDYNTLSSAYRNYRTAVHRLVLQNQAAQVSENLYQEQKLAVQAVYQRLLAC
jgi:glutamate-ammonia-ligase adenylyltransferase